MNTKLHVSCVLSYSGYMNLHSYRCTVHICLYRCRLHPTVISHFCIFIFLQRSMSTMWSSCFPTALNITLVTPPKPRLASSFKLSSTVSYRDSAWLSEQALHRNDPECKSAVFHWNIMHTAVFRQTRDSM